MIDLEQATLDYWRMSQTFEGRSNEKITTEKAVQTMGKHLRELNPQRRVAALMGDLQGSIIEGRSRPRSVRTPTPHSPNKGKVSSAQLTQYRSE